MSTTLTPSRPLEIHGKLRLDRLPQPATLWGVPVQVYWITHSTLHLLVSNCGYEDNSKGLRKLAEKADYMPYGGYENALKNLEALTVAGCEYVIQEMFKCDRNGNQVKDKCCRGRRGKECSQCEWRMLMFENPAAGRIPSEHDALDLIGVPLVRTTFHGHARR